MKAVVQSDKENQKDAPSAGGEIKKSALRDPSEEGDMTLPQYLAEVLAASRSVEVPTPSAQSG